MAFIREFTLAAQNQMQEIWNSAEKAGWKWNLCATNVTYLVYIFYIFVSLSLLYIIYTYKYQLHVALFCKFLTCALFEITHTDLVQNCVFVQNYFTATFQQTLSSSTSHSLYSNVWRFSSFAFSLKFSLTNCVVTSIRNKTPSWSHWLTSMPRRARIRRSPLSASSPSQTASQSGCVARMWVDFFLKSKLAY